ncbi:helix-turn-helix domain-containing protein [Agrobacterium sp. D14]
MVRRFSEEIWLTAKEWLTERRISRARHLLKSTGLTIADVCHATR